MTAADESGTQPDVLHRTWAVLDEARQVLLRAESIVVLLGSEAEVSPHHTYAADVAGDLLAALKEKLSQAQEIVRPPRRLRSPTTLNNGD